MWGDRSSAPQACHSRSERVRTQHRGVEMQCSPVNSAAPQDVCQLYLPISPHTPPHLPQVVCQLAEARAHSLGGQPVNALLPALSAVALCEGRGLRGLYSSAAQLLGSV